jgi:predicted XRE-type DNA-binding protein
MTDLDTFILEMATENPSMTQQQIADELHTNQSKVNRVLMKQKRVMQGTQSVNKVA